MDKELDLATIYNNFVNDYEKYLQRFEDKNVTENLTELQKALNKEVEKYLFPWREFNKENLIEEFKQTLLEKPKKLLNKYLVSFDYISDDLIEGASQELKLYYEKNNKNINEDEIFKIALELSEKSEIDKNIYSKDVIDLHKIVYESNNLYKDLTDYYLNNKNEKMLDDFEIDLEK